jgi:hypothetical protein
VVKLIAIALGVLALAPVQGGAPQGRSRARRESLQRPDFEFARVHFNSGGFGRRAGWAHDYPQADQNFLTCVSAVSLWCVRQG